MRGFCAATGIDETTAVGYCTDAPFMADFSAPVVIFGPGKSSACHKPNEFIEISDLEKGKDFFKKIIIAASTENTF